MSPVARPGSTFPISTVWVTLKVSIQGLLTICLSSVKHSSSNEPMLSLQKVALFSRPGKVRPIALPPMGEVTAARRKDSSVFASPFHLCLIVFIQTKTSHLSMASRVVLKDLRIRSSSSVFLVRRRAMSRVISIWDVSANMRSSASLSVRNCLVRKMPNSEAGSFACARFSREVPPPRVSPTRTCSLSLMTFVERTPLDSSRPKLGGRMWDGVFSKANLSASSST